MNKIKIGVLCKDISQLQWWELKLLDGLLDADWAEIKVLIMDGSAPAPRMALVQRMGVVRAIAYVIMKIILAIERRILKPPKYARAAQAIQRLESIERFVITPLRKGFVDRFSTEDVETIKCFELDVLIRHNFGIIKGEILSASKHGIWSLHHGDNAVNRGGPPGFWEIVRSEAVTGVTLQRLTDELDGGLVIGKAFYSTQRFFSKNADFIHEKSSLLVLKWLRLLAAGHEIPYVPSGTYAHPLYRIPGPIGLLRYAGLAATELLRRLRARLLVLLGVRSSHWGLSIGRGNLLGATLWRSQDLKSPRSEFWADPFVLVHQGRIHVLFENYSFARGKADISYGVIKEGRFEFGGVALAGNGHLSYPFVIEHEGSIYMLPEAYQAKRLEVWKATKFPTEWALHATALEGQSVVDPTVHIDDDGRLWLFVNISRDAYGDHNSELHVYQIDGFGLHTLTPHRLNPVLMDCRGARNAGRIFRWQGKVVRPSQINEGGTYGAGLKFAQIVDLSLDAYREVTLETVYPNFKPGLVGIHHAEQFEGGFMFDSCRKYRWR